MMREADANKRPVLREEMKRSARRVLISFLADISAPGDFQAEELCFMTAAFKSKGERVMRIELTFRSSRL